MPDENDLPDEDIFAMWEEADPVEIAEAAPPDWLSGWSSFGQTEPEQWRATVKHWERAFRLTPGVPWQKEWGTAAYKQPSRGDVEHNKRVPSP